MAGLFWALVMAALGFAALAVVAITSAHTPSEPLWSMAGAGPALRRMWHVQAPWVLGMAACIALLGTLEESLPGTRRQRNKVEQRRFRRLRQLFHKRAGRKLTAANVTLMIIAVEAGPAIAPAVPNWVFWLLGALAIQPVKIFWESRYLHREAARRFGGSARGPVSTQAG